MHAFEHGVDQNDHNYVHALEQIVGASTALKSVLEQVRLVAPTSSTVLIQGETGTASVFESVTHSREMQTCLSS